MPRFQTAYRPATTPIGYFGGYGGGAPMFDVSTLALSKISAALAPTIDEMFSHFQAKSESEKDRLQLILSRLSQAKRRFQIEDQMLDVGIALEMILLDDNEKDQLSLQFRLRGSWLIGQSSQDRLENWNLLQEIYNARSSVAHTGMLYKNNPLKIQKIREALPKYLNLAESILRKIIVSGTPVWRDLVLGAPADAILLIEGSGQGQPD
ncbi:HEPN domain-containing protein [Rhodoferax sp.]|uniref:HEPN domain-containing protein n=1 Tax=Rhodoferax sp. TaxID=50421 RepID=UPI0025D2FB0B|nr:HEPN domain-containing protein [Rhodoferax sp.]